MTAAGWMMQLAVVAIEILCYFLFRFRVISPQVTLGLILVTFGLATYFLPYLTPVRSAGKVEARNL